MLFCANRLTCLLFRFGPRFPAMSSAYDKDLRKLAKNVAKELGFDFIHEGVYSIQMGPAFETVAECRLLRTLGADVTGSCAVLKSSRSTVFFSLLYLCNADVHELNELVSFKKCTMVL